SARISTLGGRYQRGIRVFIDTPCTKRFHACASSPFGQTGAEQPCRKFFSATSLSQNKDGGFRARYSPSNQRLLAVQIIVSTVTREVQLRSNFQRFEIWSVFKSMVTARRNVRQSGNHCSADRQAGSRHTEAWTRSGGKPNCGKQLFAHRQ